MMPMLCVLAVWTTELTVCCLSSPPGPRGVWQVDAESEAWAARLHQAGSSPEPEES